MKQKKYHFKNLFWLILILCTVLSVNAMIDRVTFVDYQRHENNKKEKNHQPKEHTGEMRPAQ